MSIQPRRTKHGTKYDVRWQDGGQHRCRTFDEHADALEYEAERKRAKRLGAFAPREPSAETLTVFLERWFRTGQWALTTTRSRAHMIDRWIVPYIGDVPLRELGRARVRDFRAGILAAGSRPTNTNNVLRCLSAALGVAVEEGLIPYNPCATLRAIPTAKPERRALAGAVTDAILAQMPTVRDRAVFCLLLDAGLRPAEATGLRWHDVGAGAITVYGSIQGGERVRTKTGVFRSVPIEPRLRDALDALPTNGRSGPVVPGEHGGPLNWHNWTRRVWGPARERAGSDAVPYDLRHTRVHTLLVERGMDVVTAAAMMGHSPAVMLDHYAHLIQSAHAQGGRTSRAARGEQAPGRQQ